jgi:dienelactone hydrolase
VKWRSPATDAVITGEVRLPAEPTTQPARTVVYLKNLSIPRLGTETDDATITSLRDTGHLILVLDYAHHPKAISPNLNADVLKLRDDIAGKTKSLLTDQNVDPNRLYIVPEGFRLAGMDFARDGKRALAMDVIYPANPKAPVPILMEITCDNQNRMGSSSLLFCRDTLLEGGALAGFAVAMVDHPVPPPYKGIDDPMPESLERMQRAVAALRRLSKGAGTSEKIGAIGFSRAGPFAAMLAAQGDVQAALIHGNRYDYLDLIDNDPMLARFEKAWGKRDDNRDRWAIHGASHYLTNNASPMFLNTSDAESPEYRHGLERFAALLKERNVEHVYQVDRDGRGHRVTTDPATLQKIYDFFREHLK